MYRDVAIAILDLKTKEYIMSKFLKEDSRQHHYETIVREEHVKEINRINTFREMSNEYQDVISAKYRDGTISHNQFGLAMTYYKEMRFLTKLCLLQIENNMISNEYVSYMKDTAKAVDKLERIANG